MCSIGPVCPKKSVPYFLASNQLFKLITGRLTAKLWKQHEKAEKIYDRAVEKKEKAGDAFGRSFEGKGIGNHELEWKVYHKACKEITEARKKQIMVRQALGRFGFH
ncbi:hypothetical protein GLOIN_2v1779779 [Rhizophagus irregularis DAOM 181602=DAOM 197198]|nr:hypothetical protein GLOIN_2v1779779 [Rhizophagus irregularis DAOM 181602=DAOM 197198]